MIVFSVMRPTLGGLTGRIRIEILSRNRLPKGHCVKTKESDAVGGWDEAMSLLTILGRYPGEMSADAIQAQLQLQEFQALVTRVNLPGAAYDGNGQLLFADDGISSALPSDLPTTDAPGFSLMTSQDRLLVRYDLKTDQGAGSLQPTGVRFVVFGIDRADMSRVLRRGFPGFAPSPTEFRLLCGLLAGKSLPEVARDDGVTHNTRRKQLQMLLGKMGLSRQADLVRVTAFSITDYLLDHLAFSAEPATDVTFLQDRYGDALRIHDVTVGNKDRLRVFELGPMDGRPCILFHPMLFPLLPLPNQVSELEAHGTRLLIPLRPFFCGSQRRDILQPAEMVAELAQATQTLCRLFGIDKTPVVATVFGAIWATEFAFRSPELVSRLVFVSAPSPSAASSSRSFVHAMLPLVRNSPSTADLLVKTYAKALRSEKLVERGFLHAYRKADADTATLRRLLAEGWLQRYVQNVLSHSGTGVANELRVNGMDWTSRLAAIDTEMIFLHGEADQMSPLDPIRALADRLPQARLDVVADAGQLLYLDRFDRILDAAMH